MGMNPGFCQTGHHTTRLADVGDAVTTVLVDTEIMAHTCADRRDSMFRGIVESKSFHASTRHGLGQKEIGAQSTALSPRIDLDVTLHVPDHMF